MLLLPSASQCSDKLGLSLELGSFVAGVMISTTDFAQHTLEQVLFILSDGALDYAVNAHIYPHE